MLTARCALGIVVFGLLASVSCAGRRRADPSATQEVANCPGRAYLEVTNCSASRCLRWRQQRGADYRAGLSRDRPSGHNAVPNRALVDRAAVVRRRTRPCRQRSDSVRVSV